MFDVKCYINQPLYNGIFEYVGVAPRIQPRPSRQDTRSTRVFCAVFKWARFQSTACRVSESSRVALAGVFASCHMVGEQRARAGDSLNYRAGRPHC